MPDPHRVVWGHSGLLRVKVLVIKGRVPALNELLDAQGERWASGGTRYQKVKKHWAGLVTLFARTQAFNCKHGGHFTYIFREPNRRRDPSNVIAGGIKIIEDSLQMAGLLDGDGWKHVMSITPIVLHDENPSTTVIVTGERPTEKEITSWTKR